MHISVFTVSCMVTKFHTMLLLLPVLLLPVLLLPVLLLLLYSVSVEPVGRSVGRSVIESPLYTVFALFLSAECVRR